MKMRWNHTKTLAYLTAAFFPGGLVEGRTVHRRLSRFLGTRPANAMIDPFLEPDVSVMIRCPQWRAALPNFSYPTPLTSRDAHALAGKFLHAAPAQTIPYSCTPGDAIFKHDRAKLHTFRSNTSTTNPDVAGPGTSVTDQFQFEREGGPLRFRMMLPSTSRTKDSSSTSTSTTDVDVDVDQGAGPPEQDRFLQSQRTGTEPYKTARDEDVATPTTSTSSASATTPYHSYTDCPPECDPYVEDHVDNDKSARSSSLLRHCISSSFDLRRYPRTDFRDIISEQRRERWPLRRMIVVSESTADGGDSSYSFPKTPMSEAAPRSPTADAAEKGPANYGPHVERRSSCTRRDQICSAKNSFLKPPTYFGRGLLSNFLGNMRFPSWAGSSRAVSSSASIDDAATSSSVESAAASSGKHSSLRSSTKKSGRSFVNFDALLTFLREYLLVGNSHQYSYSVNNSGSSSQEQKAAASAPAAPSGSAGPPPPQVEDTKTKSVDIRKLFDHRVNAALSAAPVLEEAPDHMSCNPASLYDHPVEINRLQPKTHSKCRYRCSSAAGLLTREQALWLIGAIRDLDVEDEVLTVNWLEFDAALPGWLEEQQRARTRRMCSGMSVQVPYAYVEDDNEFNINTSSAASGSFGTKHEDPEKFWGPESNTEWNAFEGV
ncbi:unnamed protein product [Amoebophrya sp. A120]|nr:unnamed protein product [Amoebophrya sp. A120]|eukprot:GSA120T00021476001.1